MAIHTRFIRRALLAATFAALASPLAGQTTAPATAPATTSPATAPVSLTATITGVEGIVQVRADESAKWQPAKVGMTIGEGAEFRTGPRSAVRFTIPPDQTITLDRLGTVKLIEAIRSARKIKTDLGMKYGRVRYDIEAAGQEHDSTIHSPGSALAVRGTRVSLYDQPPFKPQAVSLTGAAMFRNARKQMVAFGAKGAKTNITSTDASPAQTAMVNSMLNSPVLVRTEQELRELNFLFSHQGEVFGRVAAGNVRVSDPELPNLISGNLDFVLRWSAPEGADLNLVVNTPRGETFGNPPFILSLFPDVPEVKAVLGRDFPQSTPSGGHIGLNHIGPEGIEIASFDKDYPRGTYVIAAYNFLYSDKGEIPPTGPKVPFTLEAFQNGKRQPLVLNLAAALAGLEPPRFGLVYHDAISIGELSYSALQILDSSATPPQPTTPTTPPQPTTPVPTRPAKAAAPAQTATPTITPPPYDPPAYVSRAKPSADRPTRPTRSAPTPSRAAPRR